MTANQLQSEAWSGADSVHPVDKAEFVVADARTHAFAEGAFDLVISQFP